MESNPKIHVEMNSLNPSLHGKNGVLASCVGQISFFPQSSGGAGDGPRVFGPEGWRSSNSLHRQVSGKYRGGGGGREAHVKRRRSSLVFICVQPLDKD